MTDQVSERDDSVAGGPGGEGDGRVVSVDDDPTPAIGTPLVTADTRVTQPAAPAVEVETEPRAVPPRQRRFFGRRRVSKWDRPPDPHDWRFFVGGLGKILIATGLLLFGFVAYQLWGTGIETARAQNALENDFEAALAETEFEAVTPEEVEVPATAPTDPGEAAPDDPPATVPPDDAAADDTSDGATPDDGAAIDAEPDAEPDAGGPADPPPPVDPDEMSGSAVEQAVPDITRGQAIGRLEMPTIDKSVFVVPGVEVDDLKDGPGHYPDTPLPGQLGNSAIAGHRTTYGEPFIDLDDLTVGDDIVVTTLYGRFVYQVTGSQVVGPGDSWVVQTTDWDTATLTLTTCHPKWTARERLIVSATLDRARSTSVGEPTFYDLDGGSGGQIPADDPTIDTTLPADDAPAVDADGTADVDRTDPATAATDDGAGDAVGDDGVGDEASPEQATSDDATSQAGDAEIGAEVASDADPATERPSEPEVAAPPVAVSDPPAAAPVADGQPTPEDAFSRSWFDDDEAFPQIALWGAALTAIALLAYALSRRVRHDSVGFLVGIGPFLVALYFFFQNVHRLLPPGI